MLLLFHKRKNAEFIYEFEHSFHLKKLSDSELLYLSNHYFELAKFILYSTNASMAS